MSTTATDRPKLLRPAPGCFVRQEVDNIAWLDMGDYLLVVDALEQTALEAEVMESIAATTGGKPVGVVINTHTHQDHVALNDAFQRRFGAQVVNAQTHVIPPAGLVWTADERRVEAHALPGCHTDGDLIVWLPRERLLFTGDIFGWGLIPWDHGLDRPRLDHIVATYERLAALEPTTVVPGHGPLCTVAELRRWITYVRALHTDVRQLCHEDAIDRRTLDTSMLVPPEDMRDWWRFVQWKHGDCVAKIVHAVSRGRL
jgi:glyoxylase-like metal-dependent hydrolase (beta-lactamase superfamily II)